MKTRPLFLLILFLTFNAGLAFSQAVNVKVWTDTNKILIGDHLNFFVQVNSSPPTEIIFPEIKDSLGKLEIVQSFPIDTQMTGNEIKLQKKIVLTAFDTGNIFIPQLNILYLKKATNQYAAIFTDSIPIFVKGIEVDTSKDIKDIKGIIEVPLTFWDYFPYILIPIGILGLGYLIFFLMKRKGKKQASLEPKIPPHTEAMEALKQLDKEKLWQKGLVKEFHIRLTEIIRRYIERRFGIPALEMISNEIIQSLENEISLDTGLTSKLHRSFEISDLVKFAKYNPISDENNFCFKTALEFVEATIPTAPENPNIDKQEKVGE